MIKILRIIKKIKIKINDMLMICPVTLQEIVNINTIQWYSSHARLVVAGVADNVKGD